MLRLVLAVSAVLLTAAPVAAQAAATYTLGEYVEARRPVIVKRQLSSPEKAEANRLASEIRAGVNRKNPLPHALLEQLAPLAASGDRALMQAMLDGYDNTVPVDPAPLDDVTKGWEPIYMVRSLWAAALWTAGDHSKQVWKNISMCAHIDRSAIRERCPFDVVMEEAYAYDKIPNKATIVPYLMVKAADQEKQRFETLVASIRDGDVYTGGQLAWAETWAKRNGEQYVTMVGDATRKGAYNRGVREENKRIFAIEDRKKDEARWTVLQAKRVDEKAKGHALSEKEEAEWVQVSHWLGGKYLKPYASETVILSETVIDSLCREDNGPVCQRQVEMYQARADAARREFEMSQAPLRRPGSSDVSVRSYDTSGNYLGTVSMPSWQADIAGAH